MSAPSITCLMATRPERLPMALRAIGDFAAQTHAERSLVVAVGGDDPATVEAILTHANKLPALAGRFRVVSAGRAEDCGSVRQRLLSAAQSDYCVLWDDDDRNHPRRLEVQAGHLGCGGCGAALECQLVLDARAGTLSWVDAALGPPGGVGGLLPATLMYRRNQVVKYEPGPAGAVHSLFLLSAKHGRVTAVDDHPYLCVKVIHGGNTTGPDQLRRWAGRRAVEGRRLATGVARFGRELDLIEWQGRAPHFPVTTTTNQGGRHGPR